MALAAAQKIVEKHGLAGLTARRVAKRMGYSTGTIYNVFDSFTDLIVQMNGHTLDALYNFITADEMPDGTEAVLKALAARYIRFTTEKANLWSVVFATELPRGDKLPGWYHSKMQRLLHLLEEAIKPLFAAHEQREKDLSVRVLWSALHGICSLLGARVMVTEESAKAMADDLISRYLAGLRGDA
jgi:AcrR family transcriptional regulator